jgi:maltooligosyltrehalose trehalohydrolase
VHAKGVHFRVWAPSSKRVSLVTVEPEHQHSLDPEGDGYYSAFVDDLGPSTRYRFLLDQRGPFPDPASRFQPEGPHGPSEVIDPRSFEWNDGDWRGVNALGQVLYELHIGTFTPEGTWHSAARELPALAELGVTALEVMPVADFPGRFGWGYDGVDLFAPSHLYGRPDDFRRFVDRAHALGMGVILDVVYNHIGPDGNYLKEFASAYFTDRYANEWGKAINFDGRDASPVREFFTANAAYWIAEYHLDGLRLDATQQIFDASARHILKDIEQAVRHASGGRATYITAENERQEIKLLTECGLDAQWNDDFHHSAVVALTGHREGYYSDHHATPQEFISAAKYGFLFQGQYYAWQQQPRGTPMRHVAAHGFVHFLENHDQVANRALGARLHQLAAPGQLRAMTALLLLGPQTPLLFQGQEFASAKPFLYFADHNEQLAPAVAQGRAEFMRQFPSAAAAHGVAALPHDPETFRRCVLDHSERQQNTAAWTLHRDLIRLRKTDPVIARAAVLQVDGAVIGPDAFVLRYFTDEENDRLLVINLGKQLNPESIAEPLVAPCPNARWRLLWSSEDPRYGGGGIADIEQAHAWQVPGHSATLLAAEKEP